MRYSFNALQHILQYGLYRHIYTRFYILYLTKEVLQVHGWWCGLFELEESLVVLAAEVHFSHL